MSQPTAGEEQRNRREVHIGDQAQGIVVGDHATVHQTFIARLVNGIDSARFHRTQLFGFVGLAILLLGLILPLWLVQVYRPPACMPGDFRIAITSFTITGLPGQSIIARDLPANLYLHLQQDLLTAPPGLILQVWGPDRVGEVAGRTPQQRAESAASLARKLCADLVVYGEIDATRPDWIVTPHFYITSQNFYQGQEILGPHELGAPFIITAQDEILRRSAYSTELAKRVKILSSITLGLAYYADQQYEQALDAFTVGAALPDWPEEQGKQVIYLLMGNAAARAGQVELAETHYSAALRLDPNYARALIGMGSVAYQRAIQPFEESLHPGAVDRRLLAASIAWYEQSLAVPNQPELADIPAKAHFGLGQCYLMQVYAGEGRDYQPAIRAFQNVVDAYGDGQNPRLRPLAAESHALMALSYALSNQPRQSAAAYRAAAALLTDDPARSNLYLQSAARQDAAAQPTPLPSATATPNPQQSPTITPIIPTPTPNPTLGPIDVQPDQVLQEVRYVNTGGSLEDRCNSEIEPVIYLAPSIRLLTNAHVRICGWKPGANLSITLTDPQGKRYSAQAAFSDPVHGLAYRLPDAPGTALGQYTLTVLRLRDLDGENESHSYTYQLLPALGPGLYLFDAPPGQPYRILLYGFQPGETVTVYPYQQGQPLTLLTPFELAVNNSGQAILNSLPDGGHKLARITVIGSESGEAFLEFP